MAELQKQSDAWISKPDSARNGVPRRPATQAEDVPVKLLGGFESLRLDSQANLANRVHGGAKLDAFEDGHSAPMYRAARHARNV